MPLFSAFCTVNHFSPFGRILATSEIPQPLSHQTKNTHTHNHPFLVLQNFRHHKNDHQKQPTKQRAAVATSQGNPWKQIATPNVWSALATPKPVGENLPSVSPVGSAFLPRGGEVTFTFPNALRHGPTTRGGPINVRIEMGSFMTQRHVIL